MKGIAVALSAAALAGWLGRTHGSAPTPTVVGADPRVGPSAAHGVDVSALPPGQERDLLFRVCSECHGIEDVTAERRTPAEWRTVADDMLTRGAQATADNIQTIVRYLSVHVGHVNVNRASAEDLKAVLDLPREQAEAIVAFRARQGEFHGIDDVKKVPGIDGSAIEERKDAIVFSDQ